MRNKHVFVRPARNSDIDNILNSFKTTWNNFDPDIIRYPSSFTLCAFSERPLVYMPVQQCFMLESLAITPDATDVEIAVALKELVQAAVTQAYIKGVGEIYFLGTNEESNKLARDLFEELPYKVFRLKLKKLEK